MRLSGERERRRYRRKGAREGEKK